MAISSGLTALLYPAGRERILVLDLHPQVRRYAQHGQVCFFFQHGKAGPQDLHIAPELVDDEPPDAGTLVGFQQLHSAVQLREYAAPVDIARQQHRRIHQLCKAHVDDIVAFRLISAGLPAPSITIMSFSAQGCCRLPECPG